ncbi:MAG: hypothetical protein NZ602_17005 [Thermoguttaceae bacterium]|nr:hypothetical protein [Thermoguttaceae bacterium]
MWRAFFQAVGIFLFILGVECLGIEQAVLRIHDPPNSFMAGPDAVGPPKVFKPTEWMPFSLMATGAITIIYSFTLSGLAKKEG